MGNNISSHLKGIILGSLLGFVIGYLFFTRDSIWITTVIGLLFGELFGLVLDE